MVLRLLGLAALLRIAVPIALFVWFRFVNDHLPPDARAATEALATRFWDYRLPPSPVNFTELEQWPSRCTTQLAAGTPPEVLGWLYMEGNEGKSRAGDFCAGVWHPDTRSMIMPNDKPMVWTWDHDFAAVKNMMMCWAFDITYIFAWNEDYTANQIEMCVFGTTLCLPHFVIDIQMNPTDDPNVWTRDTKIFGKPYMPYTARRVRDAHGKIIQEQYEHLFKGECPNPVKGLEGRPCSDMPQAIRM